MNVISIIDQVMDGKKRKRDLVEIKGAMVHRCGVNLKTGEVLGYNALDICNAFLGRRPEYSDVARATGGENAYTFYIGGDLGPPEYDGKIWQAIPLNEVGYHGRRFSTPYVGIGLIFDGRYRQPSEKQRNSLSDLLVGLSLRFGFNPSRQIKGHGEVIGAHDGSKAPGRRAACPGHKKFINMNIIRDEVERSLERLKESKLKEAGIVFGS